MCEEFVRSLLLIIHTRLYTEKGQLNPFSFKMQRKIQILLWTQNVSAKHWLLNQFSEDFSINSIRFGWCCFSVLLFLSLSLCILLCVHLNVCLRWMCGDMFGMKEIKKKICLSQWHGINTIRWICICAKQRYFFD